MKTRKFLAALLVLCMVLGCMGVTAFAEEYETIAVGDSKVISVPADDEYVDVYVHYSFIPEESGTYAFLLTYEENEDILHSFYLDVAGLYYNIEGGVAFEAEAGQEYELMFNYWGEYTEAMEYTLSLEACQPLESIEIAGDWDWGFVGEWLTFNVVGEPAAFLMENITWEVSDPSVAEIADVYGIYVDLQLLAPGTVTLTATTESGLTNSIEIFVEEAPEALELTEGENSATIRGDDYVNITFTPEQSGYYMITTDNEDCRPWLSADSVSDGTNDYYVLEAGETYYGDISNWSEDEITCIITVEYAEDVVIPEPVAIEVTKAPDNTTYLSDVLYNVGEDQLYAGMELEVTWSDNSTSTWKYDEDGSYVGNYYLEYELVETDSDDKVEMRLFFYDLDVEPVSVELTVLDLTVDHLELADPSPLQIVENSCGIDMGELMGEGESSWYYLPISAYTREVVIVFSDDSKVNAKPGEYVYGMLVTCEDNQYEQTWTKDGDNKIVYYYADHSVELDVEIVDSPVESIELVTPPTNSTVMLDEDGNMIGADGEMIESFRQLLEGMSLKVNYKDDTSKTFAAEDFEWIEMEGMEYPFVDGYPIGIVSLILGMMDEEAVPPCEIEMPIEYMGAETSYTLTIVEEFEEDDSNDDDKDEDTDKDELEPIPETGDVDVTVFVVVAMILGAAVVLVEKKKLF